MPRCRLSSTKITPFSVYRIFRAKILRTSKAFRGRYRFGVTWYLAASTPLADVVARFVEQLFVGIGLRTVRSQQVAHHQPV